MFSVVMKKSGWTHVDLNARYIFAWEIFLHILVKSFFDLGNMIVMIIYIYIIENKCEVIALAGSMDLYTNQIYISL